MARHLLPRVFGFELIMAPYAVAHLKLGWLLKDTGYDFTKLWFSPEADRQRLAIRAKECHCTHSCFMSSSLVFDWRTWGAYFVSTVTNFLSAA